MNLEPIFWGLIGCLLIYEVVTLYFTKSPSDHITAIVKRVTKENPLLPFILGLLMGHFFW